jgi:putative phosphoesterase
MIIGLISDTHGSLPAAVFDVFKDVDQILHAGDIGDPSVITELETIAPVSAIYGNIDTWPIVSRYPLSQTVKFQSYSFYLIHEVHSIKYFRFELFKKNLKPDIVVYGHTHIPAHEYYQDVLFINPGSASRPKLSKKGSLAKIELTKDKSLCTPEFFEISWR